MRNKIQEAFNHKDSGIELNDKVEVEISAEALEMIRDILKNEPCPKTCLKHTNLISCLMSIKKKVGFKEPLIERYGTTSTDHYKEICLKRLQNLTVNNVEAGFVSSDEESWLKKSNENHYLDKNVNRKHRMHKISEKPDARENEYAVPLVQEEIHTGNYIQKTVDNENQRKTQQRLDLLKNTKARRYELNQYTNQMRVPELTRYSEQHNQLTRYSFDKATRYRDQEKTQSLKGKYDYVESDEDWENNEQGVVSYFVDSDQEEFNKEERVSSGCEPQNQIPSLKGKYERVDSYPSLKGKYDYVDSDEEFENNEQGVVSYFVDSDQEEFNKEERVSSGCEPQNQIPYLKGKYERVDFPYLKGKYERVDSDPSLKGKYDYDESDEELENNEQGGASYFMDSDKEDFNKDEKEQNDKSYFVESDQEDLDEKKKNDATNQHIDSDQENFEPLSTQLKNVVNLEKKADVKDNFKELPGHLKNIAKHRIESEFVESDPDDFKELPSVLKSIQKFEKIGKAEIVDFKDRKQLSSDGYCLKRTTKEKVLLEVDSGSYFSSVSNIVQLHSDGENVDDGTNVNIGRRVKVVSDKQDVDSVGKEVFSKVADEEERYSFNTDEAEVVGIDDEETESVVRISVETGKAPSFFDGLDISSVDSYSCDTSNDFQLEDSFGQDEITYKSCLKRKGRFLNAKLTTLRKTLPLPVQRIKVSYVGLNDRDESLDRSDILAKKDTDHGRKFNVDSSKWDSTDQRINLIRKRMKNIRNAIIKKETFELPQQIMTDQATKQDFSPMEFADNHQVTVFEDFSDLTITIEQSNFQKSIKERLQSMLLLELSRGSFDLLLTRKERSSIDSRRKERTSIDSQRSNDSSKVAKKLGLRRSMDLIKKLQTPKPRVDSDFQNFDEYENRQSKDLRNYKPGFNQDMGRYKYQSDSMDIALEIDHVNGKNGFGKKVAKLFKRFW
jgi:hypothetical protein